MPSGKIGAVDLGRRREGGAAVKEWHEPNAARQASPSHETSRCAGETDRDLRTPAARSKLA